MLQLVLTESAAMANDMDTDIDTDIAALKAQCELAMAKYARRKGVPIFAEAANTETFEKLDKDQGTEAQMAALMAKCELAMVKYSKKTGAPVFAGLASPKLGQAGLTATTKQTSLRVLDAEHPAANSRNLGTFFKNMLSSPRYVIGVPIVLVLVAVFILPSQRTIANLLPVSESPQVVREVNKINPPRASQVAQAPSINMYDVRKYRTVSVKVNR
tara:strand:+ start:108 stop:752 length:645 start_codon:yes stop_codon:yes gene_type:complete